MSNVTATTPSSTVSTTDVTVTSTVSSSISSTVITETSTITSGPTSYSTITTETTSLSTSIISSVYVTPSTTTVAPDTTTAAAHSSSVVEVTSYITETPTSDGVPQTPTVITVTSTAPESTPTLPTSSSGSASASASSSQASALSASGANGSSSSSGLGSGGRIAIAVVIPIVAIALAFIFGLFFYKKRQKRKAEEAMRQKEMAEYGYNPNNDPTLAPVGAAYVENGSEGEEESSGYRGWGNTSTTQRKPSTTMGSGSRGPVGGMAMSESSSNPGGYGYQGGQGSDQYSGDTATHRELDGVGIGAGAAAAAGAGAVGGAAATRRRSQTDINRGPSNASSAYSTGHALSELSGDEMPGGGVPGPYYHEEVPYNIYNEQQSGAPYAQPVIQNVGARRDTRIERVPTFPQQQGNPGISQNF